MTNSLRQLGQEDYLRIKSAFRGLVRLAGGCENAASLTRVSKTAISDYGNVARDVFPPADVVMDLEAETCQRLVTQAMLRGWEANCRPAPAMTAQQAIEAAATLAAEVGEYSAAALKAAADGKLDISELNTLIKEMQDVLFAAQQALDDLSRLRDAQRQGIKAVAS